MWTRIKNFFKGFLLDVEKFLNPLAHEIFAFGGKLLLESAIKAVYEAEKTKGSGREKFEAAKESVIRDLKEGGHMIVENAINGAIEAAVAKMKRELRQP